MCRGAPARIVRIEGETAWLEDRTEPVSLLGIPDAAVGQYVFYHAGLALSRVEADEALAIQAALAELDALYQQQDLVGDVEERRQ